MSVCGAVVGLQADHACALVIICVTLRRVRNRRCYYCYYYYAFSFYAPLSKDCPFHIIPFFSEWALLQISAFCHFHSGTNSPKMSWFFSVKNISADFRYVFLVYKKIVS